MIMQSYTGATEESSMLWKCMMGASGKNLKWALSKSISDKIQFIRNSF